MISGRVMCGYPFGGIEHGFLDSLSKVKEYDWKFVKPGRLQHAAWKCAVATSNIPAGRNDVVRMFLASDCEWLWFIDTDQTFQPSLLEELVASADPVERPILSATIIAYRPERPFPLAPACVLLDEKDRLCAPSYIPQDRHWRVAAAGAGCLLIHRTVLEKMEAEFGDTSFPWFSYSPWRREQDDGEIVNDVMGEDYTFCFRAQGLGFPTFLDTKITCGHIKKVEFKVSNFVSQQLGNGAIRPYTYAIIPVKDKLDLTRNLIGQLNEQGVGEIIVVDNGSTHDTRRWLDKHSEAIVVDGRGMGIHQMWNLGAAEALSRWPKCDLAFLNNDLRIGPDFLRSLSEELRSSEDLIAVSPNYDGRPLDGLTPQDQICANKYDGTGGVPGFAFMVKGEWFTAGYAFPEDCRWWYGDNDLLLTIRQAQGLWAITPKATVEHIGGGGKTGDWAAPEYQEQLKADRAAFLARWT